MYKYNQRTMLRQAIHNAVPVLAWLVALSLLLNTLYFVSVAAAPVVRDDDWYFLDAFLRRVLDGSLGLGDFFVRRAGSDHSQPLFKLILLLEWRYFNLDFSVSAVIGALASAACAVVFYWIIFSERDTSRSDTSLYLAWVAICALLFTLNADAGIWTWPLVSLGNVTSLIILLFVAVVWRAHQNRRYALLAAATLFLGISNDDGALIAVVAATIALFLVWHSGPAGQRRPMWKILVVMASCMVLVRVGYTFAPIVGGEPSASITFQLEQLLARLRAEGWWMWAVLPLTLPVFYRDPFLSLDGDTWLAVQMAMAAMLILAHLWFWWRAFRASYNRATFVSVCLMLVSYGWLAGIILGRVTEFGNEYLNQPRYVFLYSGHLIALLLMWAGTSAAGFESPTRAHTVGVGALMLGCLVLILGQVPISIRAWHARPFLEAYYAKMAHQIGDLAKYPERAMACVPELPVCNWTLAKRQELVQLLSKNRLNVFSPEMQRRHSYLPLLGLETGESEAPILSGVSDQQPLVRGIDALRSFTIPVVDVVPAAIATCGAGVVATVRWNASAANIITGNTEIWVGPNNSADLKLFASGKSRGQAQTGPWTRPGMHFVLKDKDDGKVLGGVTVGGPDCL